MNAPLNSSNYLHSFIVSNGVNAWIQLPKESELGIRTERCTYSIHLYNLNNINIDRYSHITCNYLQGVHSLGKI